MILTKEFLQSVDCCTEGYQFLLDNDLLGMEYDDVIQFCEENNQPNFAQWGRDIKTTREYFDANGSIVMRKYQVFNPLTGQHTKYDTIEEAKAALIEVATIVLEQHCPRVVEELTNENGDVRWEPTNLNESLQVIEKTS
jgi:hypothetical protein